MTYWKIKLILATRFSITQCSYNKVSGETDCFVIGDSHTCKYYRERTWNINTTDYTRFTQTKYIEIEGLKNENTVKCLTGTQQKINNIRLSNTTKYIDKMGEKLDKEGGGLMIKLREK